MCQIGPNTTEYTRIQFLRPFSGCYGDARTMHVPLVFVFNESIATGISGFVVGHDAYLLGEGGGREGGRGGGREREVHVGREEGEEREGRKERGGKDNQHTLHVPLPHTTRTREARDPSFRV